MITETADRRWKLVISVLVAAYVLLSGATMAHADDAQLEQGRVIVRDFGSRLQTALKAELGEGGPVAAIRVCQEIAPQISSELSRQNGVKVERTSLRVRNPANAAEPWQVAVLKSFDQDGATDSEPVLEYFEAGNSEQPARFVKAIPTGAVCLLCHGSVVSADVVDALEHEYPFDRARGYELGDIRGAFSITWPIVEPQ